MTFYVPWIVVSTNAENKAPEPQKITKWQDLEHKGPSKCHSTQTKSLAPVSTLSPLNYSSNNH